ncbi:MAG: hypothetical protein CK552_01685 [Actinobacteria bacterium]|nr:MAG: hypothetical protein CK552_01685 [Actinomycetota bacterium]
MTAGGPTWTGVFGDEIVRIGHERPDVVAITAAMLSPTGLDRFAAAYPTRIYDVGIAEQHAATSAAGLAYGGLHPVVALYATFLNRAFDQVLLDCALHKAGVTFVLDRAGVTGDDGASHNGMWDMAMLQVVPGLRIAAPRDESTLRAALREAVLVDDAPTVIRFPKGALAASAPALRMISDLDVIAECGDPEVLIVSIGVVATLTIEVADRLRAQGIGVLVVDPRWVKPCSPALVGLARTAKLVITVEDGIRDGGVGASISQLLRDHDLDVSVRNFGIPTKFLEQGKRAEILTEIGLTAQDISRRIVETVAHRIDEEADKTESGSVTS